MKVVGLITEYNPFHNGHRYHIEEAKRVTGADYVIAIMSGDFVQRGTPALIDKYSRTRMALTNGVDLVLELPVCYATGSAEYFAHGAVSILDRLGIVDYLCFGSEAGDIELLQKTYGLMLYAPDSFDGKLQAYLKDGLNYPAARQKALKSCTEPLSHSDGKELYRVLSEPNNILGIEYLKALHNLSSSILPVTIRREAAHYHEVKLTEDISAAAVNNPKGGIPAPPVISSATAIRSAIHSKYHQVTDNLIKIAASIPADVYQLLKEQYLRTYPVSEEDFAQIIKYKLLSENRASLTTYMDISGDLADRIKNITDLNCSVAELAGKIKTKNITSTRINRALIHLLLNIRTDAVNEYKAMGYAAYARVLGVRKESSHLLRKIQASGKIPLITKVSKAGEVLNNTGLRMLSEDIFAAHLYQQIVYEKYKTGQENEYRHGILLL